MENQEKHYIEINGELVEADEATFNAHRQMKRREKYEYERDAMNGLMSYNALDRDANSGESTIRDSNSLSLEEALLTRELHDLLHRSIQTLPWRERELIKALYFERQSERKYAKSLGLTHTAIQKRRKKTLANLRKIMDLLESFRF